MTEAPDKPLVLRPAFSTTSRDEMSVFEIGGAILQRRWRIFGWMLAGGLLAVLPVLRQKFTYTAVASFVPQTVEQGPSGLRSLAGQFGVSIGGSGSAQSPQFYADLVESPVILAPIAVDTFTVPENDRAVRTFIDLMEIRGGSRDRQLQQAVEVLQQAVNVNVSRETGVLTVSVTTQWPTLSAAIADRIVAGVNAFNMRTRQSQASEERRFTDSRLAEARASLRYAEERLQQLLQRNRQLQYTPELSMERDRLQREVMLNQEIVTSLAKAYEEARIREIRDTPLITTIQKPTVPTRPNPRGRGKRVLLGLILGALVGVIMAITARALQRRRAAGDPEVEAFLRTLSDIRGSVARLAPWRAARPRRAG